MYFDWKRSSVIRTAVLASAISVGANCAAEPYRGMVEAGLLKHTLTAGFPDWRHQFLRANLRTSASTLWDAEIVRTERFEDRGTLFVLGATHVFDDRWYGNFSMSSSQGGFYLPRARMDVTANRKWGDDRRLVTTAGLTAVNAKDGHRDRSLLLGVSYYFTVPLVVEGGVRINRSNPGAATSSTTYAALTYGRDQQHIVSLRHGRGNEAYQIIGPAALLVDVDSNTSTLTWRQWVRPGTGFQVRAELYRSTFYERRGLEAAVFREF